VIIGEPSAALATSVELRRAGLLVPAIRPPSVPSGTARLRISISSGHTDAMLERLVTAMEALRTHAV
jgi:8-amino-7-oxononanoate synthase